MKYAVIYSSKTGNTALLADKIRACLPEDKVYTQALAPDSLKPDSRESDSRKADSLEPNSPKPDSTEADLVFAGFWTDKGSCDEEMASFLNKLHGKKLFLFGTAGFGGEPEYFNRILSRVKEQTDGSNTIIGSYMCQGKMPVSVRKRYEAMLAAEPEKAGKLIENFDNALSHPDEDDLKKLEALVSQIIRRDPKLPQQPGPF